MMLMSKVDLKSIPWMEKYRPQTVDDVVGKFRDKIKFYMKKPESMPNFIFVSKTPGTGKTSLALAMAKDLDCEIDIINASQDRTLDVIRNRITHFVTTKAMNNKRKLVFLDEFDGMPMMTQDALRNLAETYSKNAFYIFTANNIRKINNAIQSRSVIIDFSKHDEEELYEFLRKICENEGLDYKDDALKELIRKHNPSIRNCVNALQDIKASKRKVDMFTVRDNSRSEFSSLLEMMKQKKLKEVKKIIIENSVDVEEFNHYIFMESINLPLKQHIEMMKLVAKNNLEFGTAVNRDIVFISRIPMMIKELNREA